MASGNVLDRPWGQTLGAVGMRKLTAQVTVRAEDGKTYAIGFVEGNVAAASSPLPNDSVIRVALTSHFISPVQVGELTRRLAAESRDEVEIVAEAGRLSAEHTATLRRRLVIQRASRTFAIDRGEFEIDDTLALPVHPDLRVPLGSVIFQGARMNFSDQRLVEDLRGLGGSFVLRSTTSDEDIARFELEGLTPHLVASLRTGASFAELEGRHRDVEPRTLQSILYALVCAGLCDASGALHAVEPVAPPPPPPRTTTPPPVAHTTIKTEAPLVTRTRATVAPIPRTMSQDSTTQPFGTKVDATPRQNATPTTPPRSANQTGSLTPRPTSVTSPPRSTSSTMSPRPGSASDPGFRTSTTTPLRGAGPTLPPSRTGAPSSPGVSRSGSTTVPPDGKRPGSGTTPGFSPLNVPPATPRTITGPRTRTERERVARDIEALIATRVTKLDQRADHFAILGLPFEAPAEAVRTAFVETSRQLSPESLATLGVVDDSRSAQRVMAQINLAFNTLNDPQKRRDYVNACRRGEATPIAPRAKTGDLDKNELAAEAFDLGESALKREDIPKAIEELGRAVTLAPTNFDYAALFTWARFCAATDKQGVYAETRKSLEKAINRGTKPVTARFYLGRVERILGHDREAMNHFQEVLLDEPNHKEAASELRFLENKPRSTPKR